MKPNRLISEKSPYLQTHAHNPVDWYPWGNEAFQKAKAENKPIFLSIGYSTCHWCHVMERESFEDDETAAILNRGFVSIKVDREERPDVDQLYMQALTQVMRQHGGWPMSMWLTPDTKPFYGGTYFPKEDGFGRPGFKQLLREIEKAWTQQKDQVAAQAEAVSNAVGKALNVTQGVELNLALLDKGFSEIESAFDFENGGLGDAPKFPQSPTLAFLLRYHRRKPESKALSMIKLQLKSMAQGGIFDHVEGGFARYSTDPHWHAPHFEKMLYDQAQLLSIYSQVSLLDSDPYLEITARKTYEYVCQDLLSPDQNWFYTARDADSEGVEGKFYVWSKSEIESILGQDAELFCDWFQVSEDGNWEGVNILHLKNFPEPRIWRTLEACLAKLKTVRVKRIPPIRDDKSVVAWNAMMAEAMIEFSIAMNEPQALRIADRVMKNILEAKASGSLKRRIKDGEWKEEATLEDYAYLTKAILRRYTASLGSDESWYHVARELHQETIRDFGDVRGFVFSKDKTLFATTQSIEDGAMPSPQSIAIQNGILLYQIDPLSNALFLEKSKSSIKSGTLYLERAPHAVPELLSAIDNLIGPCEEWVIVGMKDALPWLAQGSNPRRLIFDIRSPSKISWLEEKRLIGGPMFYACQGGQCDLPIKGSDEILKALETKTQ